MSPIIQEEGVKIVEGDSAKTLPNLLHDTIMSSLT